MDSLISQNTSSQKEEMQKAMTDIIAILDSSVPPIISSPESITRLLNVRGKKSYILKKQRRDAGNNADRRDSFIIGVPVGGDILGFKIHPDTWPHCKKIYETPELLTRLTEENDIPHILHTIHIQGFRIVFYIWEKSSILPYHTKKYPERIPEIQTALRSRIASLVHKGISLIHTEPGDFIYCPNRGTATLLDANKLWVWSQPKTINTQSDGRLEYNGSLRCNSWLRMFLEEK